MIRSCGALAILFVLAGCGRQGDGPGASDATAAPIDDAGQPPADARAPDAAPAVDAGLADGPPAAPTDAAGPADGLADAAGPADAGPFAVSPQHFPFPQQVGSRLCNLVPRDPGPVRAAYDRWRATFVTAAGDALRVQRPESGGDTVSEGIAYGMLLSVYANDQPTFDKLWQYSQHWLDGNKLMNWYISPDGTSVLGTGAASDADEDMAYALIAADARWGGKGSLSTNYIDLANTQINLIWQYEVDHSHADVLLPGDTGFNTSPLVINISYFAPAYYKAFGKVTGQTANWNNVAKTSYDIIELTLNAQNGNQSNGLVPAWSTNAGVPMAPSGSPGMPIWHQLDSCRTPFRVAVDYCWNAEPRALTYLQKITGFYSGIGAANIVDGYDLNGNPHPTNVTTGGPRAASFNGPAGVGAMATGATYATLRDQAYAGVATLTQLAGSTYYQESWTGLSLQFMTGLFPAPR
jgi:endo-1,4-beta-D-glucanase Y/predicted small lipoprotein YifL